MPRLWKRRRQGSINIRARLPEGAAPVGLMTVVVMVTLLLLFGHDIVTGGRRGDTARVETFAKVPCDVDVDVVGISLLTRVLAHVTQVIITVRGEEVNQGVGEAEAETQLVFTYAFRYRRIHVRVAHVRSVQRVASGTVVGVDGVHPVARTEVTEIESDRVSPSRGWHGECVGVEFGIDAVLFVKPLDAGGDVHAVLAQPVHDIGRQGDLVAFANVLVRADIIIVRGDKHLVYDARGMYIVGGGDEIGSPDLPPVRKGYLVIGLSLQRLVPQCLFLVSWLSLPGLRLWTSGEWLSPHGP